jgi:hypothetical protein|eukprot:CAMPEP_0172417488 /NCGR_PEP_ID=MMETSP1064-20121228/4015_1 /TAXON_ID=202472 /ORGANISM="Aulacoseira subarctica , Strain CCAP 1002/5" /LENGTH=62 /DNA_ID=CAMNT_0013155849 /DNA_START=154 /DNA_END=342 /DNA_ORIENTATION=-
MAGNKKSKAEEEVVLSKKDQKKVSKLEAQIPYYLGRNQPEEVDKVKEQIADIWAKAKQAAFS